MTLQVPAFKGRTEPLTIEHTKGVVVVKATLFAVELATSFWSVSPYVIGAGEAKVIVLVAPTGFAVFDATAPTPMPLVERILIVYVTPFVSEEIMMGLDVVVLQVEPASEEYSTFTIADPLLAPRVYGTVICWLPATIVPITGAAGTLGAETAALAEIKKVVDTKNVNNIASRLRIMKSLK